MSIQNKIKCCYCGAVHNEREIDWHFGGSNQDVSILECPSCGLSERPREGKEFEFISEGKPLTDIRKEIQSEFGKNCRIEPLGKVRGTTFGNSKELGTYEVHYIGSNLAFDGVNLWRVYREGGLV